MPVVVARRSGVVHGKASSFGDLRDRERYAAEVKRMLAMGWSRAAAEAAGRKKGDPGIGWMDNDLCNDVPWVAVPRDLWEARFGANRKSLAHGKLVLVTISGVTKTCVLGDTMPRLANIKTGAVIDLAPGAQRAFGLKAPFMVDASWEWAE